MRLLVCHEEHFLRSNAGAVFSSQGPTNYSYFSSYSQCCEEVFVLARVRDVGEYWVEQQRADGIGVHFIALPDYQGPWQYARFFPELRRIARAAVASCDLFLLRAPGMVSKLAWNEIRKQHRRYAVQVVGDPLDVFGRGGVGGSLGLFFRYLYTRDLRRMCWSAAATTYVTKSALQARYPSSPSTYVASWSDVQLNGALATGTEMSKRISSLRLITSRRPRLGFIGHMEQPYKGAEVLLRALAICRTRGVQVTAAFAGEGKLRSSLQKLADELGFCGSEMFVGKLSAGKAIFEFLDSTDLFVMPSLTEGLPRAMIEAMARGCPCIGSRVGGIPELLEECCMVMPGDSQVLADKLIETLASPDKLISMATRNRIVANHYAPDVAEQARQAFYEEIKRRSRS